MIRNFCVGELWIHPDGLHVRCAFILPPIMRKISPAGHSGHQLFSAQSKLWCFDALANRWEGDIYIYIYNEALLYPCILKVAHVCDENKPFRSSWSSWLATVLQGDAPPAAAKNRQLSHCTNSSCSMRQAGKQGSTKCDQYATLRVKTSIRSEK